MLTTPNAPSAICSLHRTPSAIRSPPSYIAPYAMLCRCRTNSVVLARASVMNSVGVMVVPGTASLPLAVTLTHSVAHRAMHSPRLPQPLQSEWARGHAFDEGWWSAHVCPSLLPYVAVHRYTSYTWSLHSSLLPLWQPAILRPNVM